MIQGEIGKEVTHEVKVFEMFFPSVLILPF